MRLTSTLRSALRQKRWWLQHGLLIIVVVAVSLVGTLILITSHAATSTVSTEVENGTISGNAQVVTDASASGRQAIQFGASSAGDGVENPTPGAVSVLDTKYGLTGNDNQDPDATDAFQAAMNDALDRANVRYANGPSGQPQAVVYVPPGSYRLSGLRMINNVRIEVSAGAVLEPIVQPADYTPSYATYMIQMGPDDHTQEVKNVSVTGVGTSTISHLKQEAGTVYSGFDISHDFTINMDGQQNGGGPNDMSAFSLITVDGFLLKNMYVINNGVQPPCNKGDDKDDPGSCPTTRGTDYPSPTTSRSNMVFRPSSDSGDIPNGPFYQPSNGTVMNIYTIHSPYGYGPNQVTAGDHLTFRNLYTEGGTTLRMETDSTTGKSFGGTVKTVNADNIVGVNCNRAVSMASHYQPNSDVHITNVTAVSCNNGVVFESENATSYPNGKGGNFTNSTITHMSVTAGTHAQNAIQSSGGRWTIGQSVNSVYVHPTGLDWAVNISDFTCAGSFSDVSDLFTRDGVPRTRLDNC